MSVGLVSKKLFALPSWELTFIHLTMEFPLSISMTVKWTKTERDHPVFKHL